MERERWLELDRCVGDALELPGGEREAFLRRELSGELLEQALRMVRQEEAAERLFQQGMVEEKFTPRAGMRMGPWELVRPLGSGGMGVVWLAQRADGAVEMQAAIKMMPVGAVRFQMEKQMLARLQHPNIARLLDASAGDGAAPNFVMEYVEGVPLLEAVESRDGALRLFLKICDAVQYAHANLIIHRDLKPQNILVGRDGEPKLLDFGIAKVLNDPGRDVTATVGRAFSLDYASPEQICGDAVSTLTDVYSLGLILYEMLTGEKARRWGDLALGKVVEEARRFEVPAHVELGTDLMAVVRKACAVEPGMRYRGVSELAADVERVMEGRPVEARVSGVWYTASCFARRNRVAVGVSVLTVTTVVGLGVWGWVSARQAEVERSVAIEKTRQLEAALGEAQAERKRAEAQTELAEQMKRVAEDRLRELAGVLESVMRTSRLDVAKLSGGTRSSVKLLESTLAQLAKWNGPGKVPAQLKALEAEAHAELAELYGGSNSNLGEKERGRKERDLSIAMWKQLSEEEPGNQRYRRAYWEGKFRRDLPTLPAVGKPGGEKWNEYERQFQAMLGRGDDDAAVCRLLGTFYFWRSSKAGLREGDLKLALRWFERNLKVDPNRPQFLRDVALMHKYLSNASKAIEERLRHSREAMDLDRRRVEADAADANARIDLSYSIVAHADALRMARQNEEAMRLYEEGYGLRKTLAMRDPENVFVRNGLVYPNRLLGEVAMSAGQWEVVRKVLSEYEWQRGVQAMISPEVGAVMGYLKARWLGAEGGDACGEYRKVAGMVGRMERKPWFVGDGVYAGKVKGCGVE